MKLESDTVGLVAIALGEITLVGFESDRGGLTTLGGIALDV